MEKNHRLFLRDLPENITKNDIEEPLRNHGTVTNVEIKEKTNALGSTNKFAFVNIITTERKLTACFQELKNTVINGCKLHVEIAKESFLARLQREREESAAASLVKPKEAKTVIEPINIRIARTEIIPRNIKDDDNDYETAPKRTKKIFDDSEEVSRSTRKTFEDSKEVPKSNRKTFDDYVEAPRKRIEDEVQSKVTKSHKVVQLGAGEQKKKNQSDEKRLKSLMEKKMTFKMRGGLIREALNVVDQKPLGKKIVFSDDMDSVEKFGSASKKRNPLFNDDDDDDGNDDILHNNEFKIRGNINKKLQTLQSNYGNDKRFTLDDRFMDDNDVEVTKSVESSSGIDNERDWQLDILQNVLGKPTKISGTDECAEKRKRGMIRYDPTNSDQASMEIPVESNNNAKKSSKVKKTVSNENDLDKEKPPELSKDTFFSVSDTFADSLKQDAQFSLLKTFGAEHTSVERPMYEGVREKQGHRFDFNGTDPFKYESSDDEAASEEKMIAVQKTESNNNWNDSLFFTTDDIRFDDARKFFNKQIEADDKFPTLRRELKQIVRSKIQNNLRKKMTWKRKKVSRS